MAQIKTATLKKPVLIRTKSTVCSTTRLITTIVAFANLKEIILAILKWTAKAVEIEKDEIIILNMI